MDTPGAPPALDLLTGWRALQSGEYVAAERHFAGMRARFPCSPDVLQGLAWARLLQGQPDGADLMNQTLNRALRRFPDIAQRLADEADAAARDGVSVPRSVGEAVLLSHAALYRRDGEEALRLARRARRDAPENGFVQANLGCCLMFVKQWDEAVAVLRQSLPGFPCASTWQNIGYGESGRGNPDEARKAWHHGLAVLPDYYLIHESLCWLELRRLHGGAAWRHGQIARRVRRAMRREAQAP